MIDKVQKIREEVERLMKELIQEKEKGFGSDVDDACILELQNVLTFIDSLQEKPVSDDLEKAAVNAFKQIVDSDKNNFLEIFKAGAEWQKQQIMKEAVDGLVICDELTHGYKDIAMHIPNNLEVGDKVRLIIIKEE